MRRLFPLFFILILIACSPGPSTADVERQVINVYVDPLTAGWLPSLHACADRSPELLISRAPDIVSANLILRVTEDSDMDGVAYQLGEVEFVVAVNIENVVADITVDDVQAIYTGKIYNWGQLGGDDAPVQLWANPPKTGLNDTLLGDGNLSTLAKQAQGPGAMRTAIAIDLYAIGFLPLADALADENIQIIELEQKNLFPVLANLPEEDQNVLSLIQCLQR